MNKLNLGLLTGSALLSSAVSLTAREALAEQYGNYDCSATNEHGTSGATERTVIHLNLNRMVVQSVTYDLVTGAVDQTKEVKIYKIDKNQNEMKVFVTDISSPTNGGGPENNLVLAGTLDLTTMNFRIWKLEPASCGVYNDGIIGKDSVGNNIQSYACKLIE